MSDTLPNQQENLFFDPFAEDQALQEFDPIASHESLWRRYKNNEIKHDYTADKFVADTQALMMDSEFRGRFEQAATIAARMHELCGEHRDVDQAMRNNETFKGQLDMYEAVAGKVGHREPLSKQKKESEKKNKKKTSFYDVLSKLGRQAIFKPKQKTAQAKNGHI